MPKRNSNRAKTQTSNLVRKLGNVPSKPVASDQMKSAASGFQTKFNSMNISNFITGGSSTSRSGNYGNQSSVHSIAGKKVGTATQIPQLATTGLQSKGNDSLMNSLAKLFSFMQKSREDEIKRRDIEKAFTEERMTEEKRRHEEFLKVLGEYTSIGTTTLTPSSRGPGGGILDMFKSMIADALADFAALKPLLKFAGNILKFVASPLFRVLLNPYVLGFATALALANYLASIVPDFSKISPEEAKNALENASERDIEKLGGREYLQTIINDFNNNLKEGETPLNFTPQTETQLRDVPPRPDTTGGKNKDRARNWDRNFGKTHNPDGTPKFTTSAKPLLSGVEESTAGAGRGNAVLDDYMARQLEQETGGRAAFGVKPMGVRSIPIPGTATPVSPTPSTSSVNDAISRNADLVMNDYTSSGSGATQPIVSSSTNSTSSPDRAMSSSATQRDDTAILNMIFNRSRAGV